MINPTAKGRWMEKLSKIFSGKKKIFWKEHFIGPFENTGYQGVFIPYPPEEGVDLTLPYTGKNSSISWKSGSVMDDDRENWSVYYIYGEMEADESQIVEISINSEAIVAAWVNEEQILYRTIPHPGDNQSDHMQSDTMLCRLNPGKNTLLIKVHSGDDPWNISWRSESLGNPEKVTGIFQSLISDSSDDLTRILARYALVEILAACKEETGIGRAVDALAGDPFASWWDKAWCRAFTGRLEATGKFQPFHDVPQPYEPVNHEDPDCPLWPRSPLPAGKLSVCDVSLSSPEEEFALAVLQGLVNREEPSLYLIHSRYSRQDRQWLEELHYEGYESEELTASQVWEKYRVYIKGAALYDGDIMEEIGFFHSDKLNQTNVLIMVCSLEDAVPLTPEMNEILKLPVLFDAGGKWDSQYEMMKWAYEELFPRMNHNILATCYPGIFLLTDYLVANRIFTFWFPEVRTLPEENLLRGILASTPPNTPIVGWWFDWMPNHVDPKRRMADAVMEEPGLLLGSFFGKILTPSHEAANLTIHSGVPAAGEKHKAPEIPPCEKDKIYYAHIMSDGDNLGEALMLRTRDLQWDKPERGSIPMGWSFAPSAAGMAPSVLNYYLRTASEKDLLVGGLGVGYTEPTIYLMAYPEQRDELFAEYGRMTEKALEPLDTPCLWLISGGDYEEDRYAGQSSGALKGIFTGYGGSPQAASARRAPENVVAFRSATGFHPGMTEEDRIETMVREIREAVDMGRSRFIASWVLNWDWRMDMLKEVQRRLGPDYVCVRPDVLTQLKLASEED